MELLKIINYSFDERIIMGFIASILTLLILGCETVSSDSGSATKDNTSSSSNWLIPKGEVFRAQGKDGIPSIDNPKFKPVSEIDYVDDDRRVLGIKVGNTIRAYPLQVMDWHEIVNDRFGTSGITITYCPLTGTGIAWESGGIKYGVSGLLFRNNLILYDRSSESRWSQMQMRAVNGPRIGLHTGSIQLIETTWKTWKKLYPDSEVLTTDTGYDRDYESYAYAKDFNSNGSAILYPIKHVDNRLEKKAWVHGIIKSKNIGENAMARVYPIERFGDQITVFEDSIDGENYVIAGSTKLNFVVAFKSPYANSEQPAFEPVTGNLPVIMKDTKGNKWDVFGLAVEGPRIGERLTSATSYTGFWFAWADFFPGIDIYESK